MFSKLVDQSRLCRHFAHYRRDVPQFIVEHRCDENRIIASDDKTLKEVVLWKARCFGQLCRSHLIVQGSTNRKIEDDCTAVGFDKSVLNIQMDWMFVYVSQ